MNIKTLCFGALALGLSAVGASTATAGGPEIRDRFEVVIDEQDEFLSELCGFTVDVDGVVQGTFRGYADGSIHVTERGTIVLSNPDTGKTLTRTFRQNVRGQGSETVDGSVLTIRFTDVVAGMPERWIADDGTTLVKDRGRAVIDGEILIDLETGDLISETFDFSVNGPHPILVDGLDPSLACGFLS